VVAQKLLNLERAQPLQRNPSLLKPLAKVFDDLDVVTNA
jgi:hypothetical protein